MTPPTGRPDPGVLRVRAVLPPAHGLRGLLAAAADLVSPACCAGCGAPAALWCASCARALRGPGVRDALPDGTPVAAAAVHDGPVRELLLAVKERERAELRPLLAQVLAGRVAVLAGWREPVVLVPVPARAASRRARGGDLLADLAARAAVLLRAAGAAASVERVLRVRHRVADQAGLGRDARRANLAGAFAVRGPAPEVPWVLVDDVVTTGATAREAVRAVLAAGGTAPLGVACATAARPPGGRPAGPGRPRAAWSSVGPWQPVPGPNGVPRGAGGCPSTRSPPGVVRGR